MCKFINTLLADRAPLVFTRFKRTPFSSLSLRCLSFKTLLFKYHLPELCCRNNPKLTVY